MTTPHFLKAPLLTTEAVTDIINSAVKKIAPTWPLDQFIAVNPYWGFLSSPIEKAHADLMRLSGSSLLMPREFYTEAFANGGFSKDDLASAITARSSSCSVGDLEAYLTSRRDALSPIRLATHIADSKRDLKHKLPWADFVTHQVSQHCAAYFDSSQCVWGPTRDGLYHVWKTQLRSDYSASLLMGLKGIRELAGGFPDTPVELIRLAMATIGIRTEALADYVTALLMSINGWASWCAYEKFQVTIGAEQPSTRSNSSIDLLAIRLAWEMILAVQYNISPDEFGPFEPQSNASPPSADDSAGWMVQEALEESYINNLVKRLGCTPVFPENDSATPTAQAVFCIDVRSEVFRRALESCSSDIHTLGFAGFFGLLISYRPVGTQLTRPQLPGLLAPSLAVTDQSEDRSLGEVIAKRRGEALRGRAIFQKFKSAASSGFSFVETFGLTYSARLLKSSLPNVSGPADIEQIDLSADEKARVKPRIQPARGNNVPLQAKTRASTVAGILGAMGLTTNFARLVLIAGHGSQTSNNPHARGLDCGACGGQTGEVNARVLTDLLNDPKIRVELAAMQIFIPESTWFIAGLHNTTTDEMHLFDAHLTPKSHCEELKNLKVNLETAARIARAERAPRMGLHNLVNEPLKLETTLKAKANDWSEVRPEWGLANNAAFIVAPRKRTRHLNLEGRAFLHDYSFEQDSSLGVLELIMTAPMVVTNWINMQYYASVTDNIKYGSGNKVLHNVVGGRLGVFEGNGGDLRIGLPMQSVHDGMQWQHTPLRLSVFIEAPRSAIEQVISKHQVVRDLVENKWLHLFQMEEAEDDLRVSVSRYVPGMSAAGKWRAY